MPVLGPVAPALILNSSLARNNLARLRAESFEKTQNILRTPKMENNTDFPVKMLAARAHEGSTELFLDEIPIPSLDPEDVLIKVASAGLAPGVFSNLSAGRLTQLPTTLGHEVAGTIAKIGLAVTSATVGDRVRVHPNISCQRCRYCLSDREQMCAEAAIIGFIGFGRGRMPQYRKYHNGGLAQYIKVPYWLVDKLSPQVSFDVAAKLQDLASAVRALKCAQLELGSTIVITAATGSMGASLLKLAEFFPVNRIILGARSAARLRAAQELTRLPTEIIALDDLGDWPTTKTLVHRLIELAPNGVDAVIDFMPPSAGAEVWQVVHGLATGGVLVHMGGNGSVLPLPMVALMTNCWRVVGTRGNTRSDSRLVLDLLEAGSLNVDELITHRFKLRDVKLAVSALQSRRSPMWMGVVHP